MVGFLTSVSNDIKKYYMAVLSKYGKSSIFCHAVLFAMVVFILARGGILVKLMLEVLNLGMASTLLTILLAVVLVWSCLAGPLVRLRSINKVDRCYIAVCIGSSIFLLSELLVELVEVFLGTYVVMDLCWIVFEMVVFLTVASLFLVLRCQWCISQDDNIGASRHITLRALCEGKATSNDLPILLYDDIPEDDMLEREALINLVAKSILGCSFDGGFVMALTGDWGSGKTSIINFSKKAVLKAEPGTVFIDDFEPWLYYDMASLWTALFDSMARKLDLGLDIWRLNKVAKVGESLIKSRAGFSFGNFASSFEVNDLKQIIGDYLRQGGRKVVLVLDNLERCPPKNALFLLNMVHNVLDVDGVVCVLSYSRDEMTGLLGSEGISYGYLEKIVQMELGVPKINKGLLARIVKQSIAGCLNVDKSLNITFDEDDIEHFADMLSRVIFNLRDLKRIVNSVFNVVASIPEYVNVVDLLATETIHLRNPGLWDEIYKKRKFFISEDMTIAGEGVFFMSERYNIELKDYFDKLFAERDGLAANEYAELLRWIFPNVDTYFRERKASGGTIKFAGENRRAYMANYDDSIVGRRVFNGRFFDSFFQFDRNVYVSLHNSATSIINKLNGMNPMDDERGENRMTESFCEIMKGDLSGATEYYVLDIIERRLSEIWNTVGLKTLVRSLFNYYRFGDIDRSGSSPIDARSMACLLAVRCLSRLDLNCVGVVLDRYAFNDYGNISMLRQLVYWAKKLNERKELSDECLSIVSGRWLIFKKDLISERADLFRDGIYCKGNIRGMVYEDKEYINLLKGQIDVDTVPLYIIEYMDASMMLNTSDGITETKYCYGFKKESMTEILQYDAAIVLLRQSKDSRLKQLILKIDSNIGKNTELFARDEYLSDVKIDINSIAEQYASSLRDGSHKEN